MSKVLELPNTDVGRYTGIISRTWNVSKPRAVYQRRVAISLRTVRRLLLKCERRRWWFVRFNGKDVVQVILSTHVSALTLAYSQVNQSDDAPSLQVERMGPSLRGGVRAKTLFQNTFDRCVIFPNSSRFIQLAYRAIKFEYSMCAVMNTKHRDFVLALRYSKGSRSVTTSAISTKNYFRNPGENLK